MTGAGELRERVTILRQVVVPDGRGGETRSWENWLNLAARVVPTSMGGHTVIGEALQGTQGFTITVRHVLDVDITHRVAWRGRTMRVMAAVDLTGKRAFTTITTDDGVVTG